MALADHLRRITGIVLPGPDRIDDRDEQIALYLHDGNGNPWGDRAMRRFLYLPDGWDDAWQTAKRQCTQTPARIVTIGDSLMMLTTSAGGDYLATTFPALLRTLLIKKYGHAGTYIGSCFNADFDTDYKGTPPWVVTKNGATCTWAHNGIGSTAAFTVNTASTLVFTTPEACTALDICDFENFGGTFDVVINGANAGTLVSKVGAASGGISAEILAGVLTITCTNTNLYGRTRRIQVTNLDNQVHTVTFQNASAVSVMQPHGVAYSMGSSGIQFAHLQQNGNQARTTADAGAPGAAYQGCSTNSTPLGGTTNKTDMGFPGQPHLALIMWGINDCAVAKTLANFQKDVARTIMHLRRGVANASIMLIGSCNPDVSASDITSTGFADADEWPYYLGALRELAEVYNCGFADIHSRWGEYPLASGFTTATNQHPTDAGHADISALLAPVIV